MLTLIFCAGFARAQTCFTASDMDEPTRAALVNTAKRYFDMAARGDSAALRQNSIASLASDFSGIETAVKDNQANLSGVQANPRSPFLLKVEGNRAPRPCRVSLRCVWQKRPDGGQRRIRDPELAAGQLRHRDFGCSNRQAT